MNEKQENEKNEYEHEYEHEWDENTRMKEKGNEKD
jgi:hypothetical protein